LADLSNKLNTNIFIGEQLTVNRESFVNMFRASLEKKEAEVVEA
jgi:hypothetical protein